MAGEKSESRSLYKIVPKGFLQSFILLILQDGPLHGYMIIKRIKTKTRFWKPSAGTIYPTLKLMEEKGLIRMKKVNNRKVYYLTSKGKKIAKEVKDIETIMREKMGKILSEILQLDQSTIKRFFAPKKRTPPIFVQIRKIFLTAFEIGNDSRKVKKAISILKTTNKKLERLKR